MCVGRYYALSDNSGKQEELSKKVAAVHAQTVMEQIKAMPCPVEQKAELIEAIKRIHQQRDGA
mgnify:CR=1 FL=1